MIVKAKQNVVSGGAIFPKDAVFQINDKTPDPAAVAKMAIDKKKVEESSDKPTHMSNGKPIERPDEPKSEPKAEPKNETAAPAKY